MYCSGCWTESFVGKSVGIGIDLVAEERVGRDVENDFGIGVGMSVVEVGVVEVGVVDEGVEEGVEMGVEEGVEEGIAEGVEEGVEEGIEEGIGRTVALLAVVRGMAYMAKGSVASVPGLPGLAAALKSKFRRNVP